jgi:Domain of unknown function (DUF3854)/Protein of unknown function (DUF3631)
MHASEFEVVPHLSASETAETAETAESSETVEGGVARIAQHHLEMLAASGITPEHAALRGYETITEENQSRLAEVNVVKPGRIVPGLLIPLLRIDGSTHGYQYRPDQPRLRDGKPIKYETPWQQRNGLDVPPGVGPKLADPSIPLFITEGTKKADCGALHGLCTVALTGVWNFMHTNSAGGKTALAEFRDIAFNGRRVIIAFDGDVARKDAVQKASHALAAYLSTKGAKVEYLWLPDTDDKTGLDDYLAEHAVEDLFRLVKPTKPPVTQPKKQQDDQKDRKPAAPKPPVDGAKLLEDLEAWFSRFIRVTTPGDLQILAAWAVHTHLVEELYTSPRLLIDSIMWGSGKTTVLDHLQRLCVNAVQAAELSSSALIPRMPQSDMRTILLDEVDRNLRPDRPGVQDLLSVLNSGYRRGATRPVLVPVPGGGWEAQGMPTFAPVAMAGNSPHLPPDTVSRSIRILLMPDLDGTVEDSDWEEITAEAEALQEKMTNWADQVRDQVKGLKVDLPKGCIGRSKEKWRPLKRVAVAAAGRWPQIVNELIIQDLAYDEAEREAGLKAQPPGIVLLQDLREHWPDSEDFVTTKKLVELLVWNNPGYWGSDSPYGKTLTEQRCGRLLSQAAKVTSVQPDPNGPRGYRRSQIEPAWRRLGMHLVDTPHNVSDDSAVSAVSAKDGRRCTVCGDIELVHPASITRGTCAECHITTGGVAA